MNTYLVTLSVKRGKINIIKAIKAITGWGLKDCKDYVEEQFVFDPWMSEWVAFDVTIGTIQMARLAHYVATRNDQYKDIEIVYSKIVEPKKIDPFDLTC